MNQEKINTLTEGLAKALALVDAVGTAARSEFGYGDTRGASKRAVGQIEALLTALQEDWARDERELDEDIENFTKNENAQPLFKSGTDQASGTGWAMGAAKQGPFKKGEI